jgi:hypothetical protein
MTTYTWVAGGGSLDDAFNWSFPGGIDPPPPPLPGSSDTAVFNSAVGTLVGSLDVELADFKSPTFVLQCQITVGDITFESGKLILLAGTTINTATAEFIGTNGDAAIEQYGGSNTLSDLVENVSAGSYLLASGTLTIAGEGLEFVGAGGFVQTGGTQTISGTYGDMEVGSGGTGTYELSGGSLSATAEFIGQEQGANGTFIQTGGTNTLSDRVVIGAAAGDAQANSVGLYVLGGNSSTVLSVQTIFVGSNPGGTGTFKFDTTKGDAAQLLIAGTNPSFPYGLIVGGQGTGTFIQGGGNLDSTLQIGRLSTGVGTYYLNAGTLKTDAGKDEVVGDQGHGTLDQVAGTNTVGGKLLIANAPAAIGNYELDGKGTLTVAHNIQIGVSAGATGFFDLDPTGYPGATLTVSATDNSTAMIVGSGGTGAVEVDNGSATLIGSGTMPVLDIGNQAGAKGDFNVFGGTVAITTGTTGSNNSTGPVIVGDLGSGNFDQRSGQVTFGGDLIVGNGPTGKGLVLLNEVGAGTAALTVGGNLTLGVAQGGTGTFSYDEFGSAKLSFGSDSVLTIGDAGSGAFYQSGGSIKAAGLVVGRQSSQGSGTFNLGGDGSLTISSTSGAAAIVGDDGSGTFVQTGGTATYSTGLDIGALPVGNGIYNFSAGMLTVGSNKSGTTTVGDQGSGTFNQTGGTGTFNSGLTIGAQDIGSGQVYLSGGTDVFGGAMVVGDSGIGGFADTGGSATFSGNLSVGDSAGGTGLFVLTGNASAVLNGEVDIGVASGANGDFEFDLGGGSATQAGTTTPNFKVGIGGSGTLNQGGGTLRASDFAVGTQAGGVGAVNVSGASAVLSAMTMEVGSFGSSNSVNGGIGNLNVAGGYVSDAKTLALKDYAVISSNGVETFSGGISVVSGGRLEVGGNGGVSTPNTLQVDAKGLLSGHGLIAGTNTSAFNVVLSGGTIEANGGFMAISGSISGSGTIKIDSGSTLEIGGSVASGITIQFNDSGTSGTGTLILDNPQFFDNATSAFKAKVTGLEAGDQIILKGISPAAGNQESVVAATIGSAGSAGQALVIEEGYNNSTLGSATIQSYDGSPLVIPISGTTAAPILTGTAKLQPDFFQVASTGSGGKDTTLTLSAGREDELALNWNPASSTRAEQTTGAGIKIGIVSDSFNALNGETADIGNGLLPSKSQITILQQNGHAMDVGSGTVVGKFPNGTARIAQDEGRAMAQVIYSIAPGASIEFASPVAEDSTDTANGLALAIQGLAADGCNIIVDDVNVGNTSPADATSIINAVNNAVSQKGITLVSAAGNSRAQNVKVIGQAALPNEISVASVNLLAGPSPASLVGQYLRASTEPDSSTGAVTVAGPDGGPTSFSLTPVPGILDPFFGTSAAAPAAAAVAALMMDTDSQLKSNPALVKQLLQSSAQAIPGETQQTEGAGYINAYSAVGDALNSLINRLFYSDPPPPDAGPTLTSAALSQPSGNAATGTTVELQLGFNEAVKITGTPSFKLSDGGTAKYDANASQPAVGTLIFDYVVGSADHTANLEITSLTGGTIADSSNVAANLSGMFSQPTGLSINSPLKIVSVVADASGEVGSGDTVHITATLNKLLTLTLTGGDPTLTLNDGATATYDSGLSNPAADKIVFDYAVAAGDETPNLAVTAVNLPTGTTIQDSSGNNVDFTDALGASLNLQVGPAFVELVTPSVEGDATTGQTIELFVDFSQALTINTSGGSPTLTLNAGASVTATYDAAHSDAAAGIVAFDYTVGAGDKTPDLEVTAYNPHGAVIEDITNNVAVNFSGAASFGTGLSINSPLVITSITPSMTGDADAGQRVQLTVTLSEPASVGDSDSSGALTLTLSDGATATYDASASSPGTGTLVFDYIIGTHDHSASLAVTSLNENNNVIVDASGNAASVATNGLTATGLTINSPLTVKSVTAAQIGEAHNGQTVTLLVTLSEALTLTLAGGAPTLTLNDGATATYDSGLSNLSTGVLAFAYAVGANDQTPNLAVTTVNLPSGSTVQDSSQNNADFADARNKAIGLAINPAVVTGVTAAPGTGDFGVAGKIAITVTMSRAVTVSGTPTLVLGDGGVASYVAASSKPANGLLVFSYTIGAGQNTANLSVLNVAFPTGASVKDAAGQQANFGNIATTFTGLQIDTTAPTMTHLGVTPNTGPVGLNQQISIEIDTSAPVAVTGAPTLTLSNGGTATFDAAVSTSTALIFNYFPATGQSTSDLKVTALNTPSGSSIADAAGNKIVFNSALGDTGLQVDANTPTVTSVVGNPKTGDLATGATVDITLNMSEAVTVSGAPALLLNDGDIATYAAGQSTATGLVFDYTVLAGDTTSALAVTGVDLEGAVIVDLAGNAANLSGAAATVGPMIDTTAPIVTKVAVSPGTGVEGVGAKITFTLTMSTPVTVTGGSPTLTLGNGASATYDSAHSNTTSLVFDYTISGTDADTAALGISSVNNNGATIADAGGNAADFSGADVSFAGLFVDSSPVTWARGSSGNFSTAANWTPARVPGAADDALITAAGTYTVSSTVAETVNSIVTAAGATLAITANTFTATSGTFAGANAGKIIIGNGGILQLEGVTKNSGTILASGGSAQISLAGATILGGTLATSGGSAALETVSASADVIAGATVASGSLVEVTSGSTLTFSGGTLESGATVETLSGGTAIVGGTVANSGTLYASGAGSLLDIAGVVNGGVAEVGNGTVDIAGASSENVSFLSNGGGGLLLNSATTYTGKVSNFAVGTSAHGDHNEYIDLTAVTYTPAVNETYSGSTSSGVLTVTSGVTTVATISMTGSYFTSNFILSAGAGGGTIITDPSGGRVHSVDVALFGNYIAGSFVTAAGQGGTVISNTAQGEQPLLTQPHA